MNKLVKKIQNSGLQFDDIRNRDWMKKDSNCGQILSKIIEVENLLMELDDYIIENGLDYDMIEEFMLQVGGIRSDFTKYVEKNPELEDIKVI